MKRWLVLAAVALLGLGGLYVGGAIFWNWFGHVRGAGEVQGAPIPAPVIGARDAAIAAAGGEDSKRILFGDLHVHTTFSTDAFLWSLPIFGGEGVHPLADACDFARYCAQLDFFAATDHAEAITPVRWEETKRSIRQCNARSGDAANPDMVSFVGFEWTQVGRTPADHYGHKNVIFPGLEDEGIAQRAIAAAGIATQALRGSPAALNRWIPFLDWKHRQDYFDFQRYIKETRAPADCDASKPSNELTRDCFESATTPGDLVRKLDEQKLRYLLIPHGTSWGFYTPPGTTLDKQLNASMRPERQTLIEVMSGHGNSEEYRSWREIDTKDGVTAECPAPSDNYEPACWRAGEIIRARCVAAGETAETCDQRAVQVRHEAANLGVAYHLLVSGEKVEDWLDSGQCKDCWVPPFNHRPRTSVQYGLAIRNFDDPANPRGFHWGFIGSSDNHRARPGTGFKPIDRLRHTESSGANDDEWRTRFAGKPQPATPMSTGITQQELQTLAGFQLTEVERQASFFTTGALAAVHSEGRTREQVFAALERREVYATSGPRILLWFELLNGAGGVVPMGGETTIGAPPRFRVRAVGDYVQKEGCPSFAEQGLPENRLRALCGGECYNPGDARHKILRIEVVRIRPQIVAGEAVDGLIEDVWKTLPCNDTGAGCAVEFTDPTFARGNRDTLYYVRAIQEPTPRVNGAGLRVTRDASGKATSVDPCWGDFRTSRSDNCVANVEERAWASPIYVSAARR